MSTKCQYRMTNDTEWKKHFYVVVIFYRRLPQSIPSSLTRFHFPSSQPPFQYATCTSPIMHLVIRSKVFFLFIGREPTTWPANNCLQIMVCSCAMPSNSVWLQIIFCSCVKETVLFSFLRSLWRENDRSLRLPRIFIKKTNSVIDW